MHIIIMRKGLGGKLIVLEIHACNNPSPVFKRCILSAVASTSSQGGGVRLDRGGEGVGYQNVSRCTKNFRDI